MRIPGRAWLLVLGFSPLAYCPVGLAQGPLPPVQLKPVLTGLTSPLYVTHARDGSGRLFVVERAGRIKVLQPGASSPTLFLDISGRILSGGERGLLGLAFHPRYRENGRLFVNYTRTPDGATVVAEYGVSVADPNLADTTETVLLTVAQPFANHNGGMIEFGPDGYLYIGVGDGGSSNDPGSRAQNTQELLGKILRIDIDTPASPTQPYSSPPTNPFVGTGLGREEIFAWGFRNPWRFSFDRSTGLLWAGDVGQGAREEVDIVARGGNYGWRVFEGTRCTGLNPPLCAAGTYVPPILEYDHSGGRCSITGGYVYRGRRGTLPQGAYLYGDYCTGELFIALGGSAFVLLPSGLNISSFGEDEAGELYVVGLGGTVHRLLNPTAPPVGLRISTDAETVHPGGILTLGLGIVNDGPAVMSDFSLGFRLPDETTLVFLTSLSPPAGEVSTVGADPRTFVPLSSGFALPAGFEAVWPDILTYTLSGEESAGTYTFFAVMVRAGGLGDGTYGPGDILGSSSHTVAVTP